MSIKTKMQELKKELLLQEASAMFEEIGYEHMKVADLAKVSHVSVGTIYAIFSSKEGLYIAYIEHQIKKFFAELEEKTASFSHAQEKIHAFIELKFLYYTQKKKAIQSSATNNPLFFNTLAQEHSEAFEKIYLFLQECFIELNPQIDTQKAKRLSYAFNGFSDGYISLWLEKDDDLMQYTDEVCELFTNMLRECFQ